MAGSPRAFFDRHPPHIQSLALKLAADHPVREVVAQLNSIGVDANMTDVGRFKRKHGVSSGYNVPITPAGTYDLRTRQYIDAMFAHDGNVFSNRYLGLKGSYWARCVRRLQDAGLVERVDDRRPARYTQIATDAEVEAWYFAEVENVFRCPSDAGSL